ncbi:MAG: DNA alkylation repair protein [Anaerolineales bacterium]
MSEKFDKILRQLKALRNETNLAGMARFGIATDKAFGIKHPDLDRIARQYKRNHALALELWASGYHEARLLATSIDDPKQVTEAQADAWVKDINSWDICDGFTGSLIDKTPFAYTKAVQWARRKEEFVRRAGFALMASLAVHDKKATDDAFDGFFPLIVKYSTDERNFVRKAVNWALRQLGKRNKALNRKAIATARQIAKLDSKTARWIAKDALRELEGDAVQVRLRERAKKEKLK